ncbi:MAG: hypothetical protein IT428_03190 [Planctomycetaceae bacterium]|nr:hypothetical protein [Planctomycetaceae bacterium]
MTKYEFTLSLSEIVESLDVADRIAGRCDDSTIWTTGGVTRVIFHRESESLDAAIRSAISDLENCGVHVTRVETEESHLIESINSELCVAQ